jgi:hypothetical protein
MVASVGAGGDAPATVSVGSGVGVVASLDLVAGQEGSVDRQEVASEECLEFKIQAMV